MTENHSESEYKEEIDLESITKHLNQPIDEISHPLDDAAGDLQYSWFNKRKNYKYVTITNTGDVAGSLFITEYYFVDGNKNKVVDFYLIYRIVLYKSSYNQKDNTFSFVFGKEIVHEISSENKTKICDSYKAFELPLTEGIYPTGNLNNHWIPTVISKIANKCPNIRIIFRAPCDDILFRDQDNKLLGRMLITERKSYPILITDTPEKFECYPGLKMTE